MHVELLQLFSLIRRRAETMSTIRRDWQKHTCSSDVWTEDAKEPRRKLHPVKHTPGARPWKAAATMGALQRAAG